MKIRSYISVLLFTLLLGCQDIVSVQAPEVLIPQKQMEQIMYESTLLNAARGYNTGMMSQTGIKPETYILEKFDVDSTTLAQNMGYYAADVETFKLMNSRVLVRLTKVYKEADSLNKIDREIKDSLRKARGQNNRKLKLDDSVSIPTKFEKPILIDKQLLGVPKRQRPVVKDSL